MRPMDQSKASPALYDPPSSGRKNSKNPVGKEKPPGEPQWRRDPTPKDGQAIASDKRTSISWCSNSQNPEGKGEGRYIQSVSQDRAQMGSCQLRSSRLWTTSSCSWNSSHSPQREWGKGTQSESHWTHWVAKWYDRWYRIAEEEDRAQCTVVPPAL